MRAQMKIRQGAAKMVVFEHRSAAYIWYVSIGAHKNAHLQPSMADFGSGSEASHYAANQVLCRFVFVNIEDLAAVLANEFGGLSIE